MNCKYFFHFSNLMTYEGPTLCPVTFLSNIQAANSFRDADHPFWSQPALVSSGYIRTVFTGF